MSISCLKSCRQGDVLVWVEDGKDKRYFTVDVNCWEFGLRTPPNISVSEGTMEYRIVSSHIKYVEKIIKKKR